jgi:branched-chain amino acid transport system ATP-binding protein
VTELLRVSGLDKSFGVKVVSDLSLSVAAGDAVGIVGPNGAGKTTLLNLIAGELAPDRGEISLDGEPITTMAPQLRCRRGIGRTYQVPRPFEGMTVFENVLVGATFGASRRRSAAKATAVVVPALERTGMLGKANHLAGSLPLLDRKRLELARALATEPRVLLLDEIAGGLTEGEVQELIGTVKGVHASGVTLVWIEHIVHALMAVVGRIMAMSDGAKIAEGEPEAVLASPQVQEVYLGVVAL